jgi:hypothetical protein
MGRVMYRCSLPDTRLKEIETKIREMFPTQIPQDLKEGRRLH